MRLTTCFFCLLFFVPAVASAQAWIHKPAEGYAELGGTYLQSQQFYNSKGESLEIASKYSQASLSIYGEVGVVERWLQVVAGGELIRRNTLADQGATTGLGDFNVGAFTGILQSGPLRLSAGLLLGLPTGDSDPSAGIDDPQAGIIAASLPTGSGAFSLTPKIALGTSFGSGAYPLRHYATGSVGYLAWFGFSDSLTYQAELGTKLARFDRVTLRLGLNGLEPIEEVPVSSFSGVGEGIAFTAWSVGVSVDLFGDVGLAANVGSALRAKSIISAVPVSASVYWSF